MKAVHNVTEGRAACLPALHLHGRLHPPFSWPSQVTGKSFKFPDQHGLPFFFVSAADGTNVVKVFETAIEEAVRHK